MRMRSTAFRPSSPARWRTWRSSSRTGRVRSSSAGRSGTLLGLYEGIPLTKRSPVGYGGVMPDRITIFRGPLCERADDEADLAAHVRVTVLHEVGHHFGMSDARLHELGWAVRQRASGVACTYDQTMRDGHRWRNWGRNQECRPAAVELPRSRHEVVEAVGRARTPVRPSRWSGAATRSPMPRAPTGVSCRSTSSIASSTSTSRRAASRSKPG